MEGGADREIYIQEGANKIALAEIHTQEGTGSSTLVKKGS